MSEKKILWLKWSDPLAHMIDKAKEMEDSYEEAARNSFLDENENFHKFNEDVRGSMGPSIIGPHGIIPLQECNLPGRLFNFWMGHTNFDITGDVLNKLSMIPGVETVDVITRYRFRLGIGKVFDANEVKKAIEEKFCGKPVRTNTMPKFDKLKYILKNKYPFWAIVILKNGSVQSIGGTKKEEVMEKYGRVKGSSVNSIFSWN